MRPSQKRHLFAYKALLSFYRQKQDLDPDLEAKEGQREPSTSKVQTSHSVRKSYFHFVKESRIRKTHV